MLSQSAQSLIYRHRANCEGYSLAFYLMCQAAGIKCACVEGLATDAKPYEGHMWNKIAADGKVYTIDVAGMTLKKSSE